MAEKKTNKIQFKYLVPPTNNPNNGEPYLNWDPKNGMRTDIRPVEVKKATAKH